MLGWDGGKDMIRADEYASWRRGSLHERLRAIMEIGDALYGVKGRASAECSTTSKISYPHSMR
jgi:hypothetical protein